MNKEALSSFVQKANKEGYGSGKEKNWKKEEDGSTTIVFESGDFKIHDNFFGGEPYGGREIIFYKGKPFWMMVYYGKVIEAQDTRRIYALVQKALSKAPIEMPIRGPWELEDGDLTYENGWGGNIEEFSGYESISNEKGQTVYWARYVGGLVDKRKEQADTV